MNDDKSWQKPLNDFLDNSDVSLDNQVLARVLSVNGELSSESDIADIELALHIEENMIEIGLQPIPKNLTDKLQFISKKKAPSNVFFMKLKPTWQKITAIAATMTAVVLFNSYISSVPVNEQPTLAEVKQAQHELVIALQYISLAKNKSAHQIEQIFNENIQQPLNRSLLKPLNHFKETS